MASSTAVLAALLLGLLLGAALTLLWTRGRTAALSAERDLLTRQLAELSADREQERDLALALAPVTSSLARVERQVETLERDRVEQYGRLDAQLDAVRASGELLRANTAALVGALRNPNSRGSWGEVQLRRVVEHAGMLQRVDFDLQPSVRTADGVVRPDAVIHLPGGRHVVVDAKAPMASYLRLADDPDDEQHAAGHARALRRHLDQLAAKQYWNAFDPTPDLVICFLPGESFLAAACAADPDLLEHALARRVVPATPSSLLALLRTVALGWQQDAVTEHARELLALGRELHGRLTVFAGHAGSLGSALTRAVQDYNAMTGSLERRVLVTARRLEEMGLAVEQTPATPPIELSVRTPRGGQQAG